MKNYLTNPFAQTKTNFKKKFIPLFLVVCGFAAQSQGAENEPFTIWKGEEDQSALQMKHVCETFSSISDHWRVVPSDLQSAPNFKIFEIVGFPGQHRPNGTHRSYESYRPKFSEENARVDSLILTRSDKPDFLDNFWTPNGLSSHIIMGLDGSIFIHADIIKEEKGQMAGTWNNRSFEVAFIDKGDHIFSEDQQQALKGLLHTLKNKAPKLQLKFGGSIFEAKQLDGISGFESGAVNNAAEIRDFLELSPLMK